jgi:hypothetical protein
MKELSIEEKAKAYDEAYKKVAVRFGSNVADEIFLKDSEDEKIRKEILSFLKEGKPYHCPNSAKRQKWSVWLEKQGEQNPAWNEEDEDNFIHLLDEIVCLGNNRNSANRLYYDRLIKFIEELKNRAQPKEKWCDKDERMLDRLIAYFEKQVALTDDDNPRYANWLKSLKDRVLPQPQQKWSEEDDTFFKAIIRDIENTQYISEDAKKDRINWLKSLRPQKQWKPSDEQIIELHRVISGCSYDIEPLVEIEEHLKSL